MKRKTKNLPLHLRFTVRLFSLSDRVAVWMEKKALVPMLLMVYFREEA